MLKKKLNILVATNHLDKVGGTETYTYTLIEELKRRENIEVNFFTFKKGEVSDKIENELGISFFEEKRYDLILANHNTVVENIFKYGYTIQTCHGIFPKLEQPSKFADFHIAISKEVQNHLSKLGYTSKIIKNGINTKKYSSTKDLNKQLKNVLSLCQSDSANEKLKLCCDKMGFKFTKANKFKNPSWDIASLINEADIVVGLGRSAYEAMSCGRPVVIFDDRSYFDSVGDGYVKDIIEESIQFNCSGRFLNKKFNVEDLQNEFLKFDFRDGLYLRNYVLNHLTIEKAVDEYIEVYIKKNNFFLLRKEYLIIWLWIKSLKSKLFQHSKKELLYRLFK
ncbi:glycosyltransferase family protein [Salegentibacter flavus]|uniref:Uncharacterized protein n=1 Tax=Salegentibacter flavus TaxID=287099 RepID=A0A1I4Y6E2_9FLAO|nr:glycosyltransferase family 4 protein [Salegentibacter flavus]SFN33070.1 hypothetical protein SAMN05660413_00524 [Salegentibacter flavus]